MKASRGNKSVRAAVLLAGVAGLALSASGCIIDGSSDNPPVCSPDLTVLWQIHSDIDGLPLTCAQATADTITALIDGGGLGTTLVPFDVACPANAQAGSFIVDTLPTSGSYNISLELSGGGALLSETPVLVQFVDCSGLTTTQRADLRVNF
jgi:hypothetical protein